MFKSIDFAKWIQMSRKLKEDKAAEVLSEQMRAMELVNEQLIALMAMQILLTADSLPLEVSVRTGSETRFCFKVEHDGWSGTLEHIHGDEDTPGHYYIESEELMRNDMFLRQLMKIDAETIISDIFMIQKQFIENDEGDIDFEAFVRAIANQLILKLLTELVRTTGVSRAYEAHQ